MFCIYLLKNIQFRKQLSSATRGQEAGYWDWDIEQRGCKPERAGLKSARVFSNNKIPQHFHWCYMKSNKLASQATPPLQVYMEK